MKVCKVLSIVVLLSALPVVADNAVELSSAGSSYVAPDPGAPVWDAPEAILFDNGSVMNSPGTGAGGADESILQGTSLGMTTLGFGHQILNDNRISDQFTIPAGETWDITNITFFAYQTGAPTTSTMTAVHVEIYDGAPPGGTVVFGDMTTDVMSSTAWSGIYRVTETTTGSATDRAIMAQVTNTPVTLGEGTYWVVWQTDGSFASGPWAPPVTITGNSTTGDGLQSTDAGISFPPALDGGTSTGQGFPFIIEGTVQGGGGGGGGGTGGVANPVPTLSTSGILVLILALIGISVVVIRRRM
jgi:hypothetical protein